MVDLNFFEITFTFKGRVLYLWVVCCMYDVICSICMSTISVGNACMRIISMGVMYCMYECVYV